MVLHEDVPVINMRHHSTWYLYPRLSVLPVVTSSSITCIRTVPCAGALHLTVHLYNCTEDRLSCTCTYDVAADHAALASL